MARLVPLLPGATAKDRSADRADVKIRQSEVGFPPRLYLRLTGADGALIGQRAIPLSDRCDDLAETVAVLLASWKTAPKTEIPPIAEIPVITESSPPDVLEWQLGAGAGANLLAGIAFDGRLELGFASLRSHWQGRLAFNGQTARQTTLAPGKVNWRHSTAALSLVWRTLDPDWLLSADAGPLLGLATISGQNFPENQRQNSFEFGLDAGLRMGRRWQRFTLWADLRGSYWLLHQRAVVTGSAENLVLAPWDLAITLGLSISLTPG